MGEWEGLISADDEMLPLGMSQNRTSLADMEASRVLHRAAAENRQGGLGRRDFEA